MPEDRLPILLFEPPGLAWLEPLAACRPVWDLRAGPRSPRELLAAAARDRELLFWPRRTMACLAPRPAPERFASGEMLLVAGHQIVLEPDALRCLDELEPGDRLAAEDGEILALRLAGPAAREFLASLDEAADRPAPGAAPRRGPLGARLEAWWEIAELGTEVLDTLAADVLAAGGWRGERRDDWPGSERVFLADGVALAPGVVLDATGGPVLLDRDVAIGANALVQGPAYLGPGTRVKPQSLILHGVFTGPQCRLGGEVEASQFQGFANKQHHGFLGHAAVGEWVNLGAGVTNSDLKNTYSAVRVRQGGRETDTGRLFVGCCLGDHVKVGIQGRLGTGSVLAPFCNWFGADFPPRYLPPFTWGDDGALAEHRLDDALRTARVVMSRRGRELDPALASIYRELFAASAPARAALV
ncbi:MAG: hypothetical protein JW819_00485 [Candidatus Krumholzibacteriota bacterium]|nr:hypothetical protein [Candidatus Krumholzibacteriota bacterium]